MSIQRISCLMTIATIAGVAAADISTYTSDSTLIGGVTNSANFNGLVNEQSLDGYQEDGIEVSVSRDYYSWDAPGLDGSEMFYANTGALELIDISLVSGEEFTDVDMQIGSGWSPQNIGTIYLWVQFYSDGSLVSEMDIDATTGEFVGFVGGGFDLMRIGSYASAEIRDSHNEFARNAIAIDNLSVGTLVPAPGSLAVGMIGLVGMRRRR
jgi:hypothetical protein